MSFICHTIKTGNEFKSPAHVSGPSAADSDSCSHTRFFGNLFVPGFCAHYNTASALMYTPACAQHPIFGGRTASTLIYIISRVLSADGLYTISCISADGLPAQRQQSLSDALGCKHVFLSDSKFFILLRLFQLPEGFIDLL